MGKLIAIEGLDGSGKDTQSKLLFSALTEEGRAVRLLSFPDYESPSSTLVKMYLGGELGKNPGDVNAYAATMMFAADRYVSYKKDWGEFFADGDSIIIANRYTTSNAIHQLSKLEREEWDDFLSWLCDFEFGKLGLPEPGLVIYLEVKPEVTLEYVYRRSLETGRKMDIHELDREYMIKCYKAAVYAADKLGWVRVQCCNEEGTALLPIDEIQAKIQEATVKFLDVKE